MLIFFIVLIISLLGTLYVMPHSIRKLRDANYVAIDKYKINQPEIPTNAGVIVLFTSFVSISLLPLVVRFLNWATSLNLDFSDLSEINLALLLVISIYGLYGLVDDLVDVGRKLKVILPITFAYPLISVIHPDTIWLPIFGVQDLNQELFWSITKEDFFRISIIPIYVMVTSNLVNMYSGYNGLQSGLSIILISALCFKSWHDGKIDSIVPIGAILGSILAFYFFNRYPSRVFEGNIGSLLFGSTIGCIIVIQEYWWFGFFILIPHTFNFLLWILWLYLMRKNPEKYLEPDGFHKKFGTVEDDGSLVVPNRLTLKWIPNYYFKLNENNTVLFLYMPTFLFCLLGLVIF